MKETRSEFRPWYRDLRVLLGAMSALCAALGLVLLFGGAMIERPNVSWGGILLMAVSGVILVLEGPEK